MIRLQKSLSSILSNKEDVSIFFPVRQLLCRRRTWVALGEETLCTRLADSIKHSVSRKNDSVILEAIDGDEVW